MESSKILAKTRRAKDCLVWSEKKCAGLALGALLWGDRALSHVAATLPTQALSAASQRLLTLESPEGAEQKRRLVRELVEEVRGNPLAGVDRLPPRARALLARHVPREHGRRLLHDALEARPDFAAPAELLQTLLQLARAPHPELDASEQAPHAATPSQS